MVNNLEAIRGRSIYTYTTGQSKGINNLYQTVVANMNTSYIDIIFYKYVIGRYTDLLTYTFLL